MADVASRTGVPVIELSFQLERRGTSGASTEN
jgi:hypothetical protein